MKSPERVVEEISLARGDVFFITDDNFFSEMSRAYQIVSLLRRHLIREKYIIQARSDAVAAHPGLISEWKRAGLINIFLGFEESSQDKLRRLGKNNAIDNKEKALRIIHFQ